MKFTQHKGAYGVSSWKSGANGRTSPARYTFPGGSISKFSDDALRWDVYHGSKLVKMGLKLAEAKEWAKNNPPGGKGNG